MNFNFLTKQYEEIQSTREYGIENLWAEVGGYIGMLMGFSLIQVFDLLLMLVKWMQRTSNTRHSSLQ